MPANLENSAVVTGLEKISFHSNPKEMQCQNMFKLSHNVLTSNARKVMGKSFKLDVDSMWTENVQMYKLDFEKAAEP